METKALEENCTPKEIYSMQFTRRSINGLISVLMNLDARLPHSRLKFAKKFSRNCWRTIVFLTAKSDKLEGVRFGLMGGGLEPNRYENKRNDENILRTKVSFDSRKKN
ncbi:hypothetical protein LguiA_029364 [Lonicera macranthoides]